MKNGLLAVKEYARYVASEQVENNKQSKKT